MNPIAKIELKMASHPEDGQLLWHYTPLVHIPHIIADKRIKTADAAIDVGEKPAVWFSANQLWEPTAGKRWRRPDGNVHLLSMHETHSLGQGPVRIGVSRDTAPHNWDAFRRLSGVSKKTAGYMKKAGYARGARISEWFVTFNPVPIELWVAVEVWGGSSWDRVYPGPARTPTCPSPAWFQAEGLLRTATLRLQKAA